MTSSGGGSTLSQKERIAERRAALAARKEAQTAKKASRGTGLPPLDIPPSLPPSAPGTERSLTRQLSACVSTASKDAPSDRPTAPSTMSDATAAKRAALDDRRRAPFPQHGFAEGSALLPLTLIIIEDVTNDT